MAPPPAESAAALQATLLAILPVLHRHCHDSWWLIGSAALHIAGVPGIAVHDVDLLLSDGDAARLLVQWRAHIDGAFQPERSDLFRSRFARIGGFALSLEIMGNLQVFHDGTWQLVWPVDRVMVEWHGLSVAVPSLSAQCAILETFGRPKDIANAERSRRVLRQR